MISRLITRVLVAALVALPLASPPAPARAASLSVVATTTHLEDWVRQVGGDRITLLPVLAGDDDPHEYQPTADDARNFEQAEIVFANGLGLETWLDPLLTNVHSGVPVVKVGEQAPIQVLQGSGLEEQAPDPHVWQDPRNAQLIVAVIRDTLTAADPEGAPAYASNAAAYTQQLADLDQWIAAQIQSVPSDQRKLVTNHDAFMYYVNRYGLTFVGSVIPSLATDAEPSAAETQQLVRDIAAQHVKAIFTETSVNPRLEQQIAKLAGVKVYSNLYGDTLGPPGSPGATYIDAMRFNTQQIVEGLR